VADIYLDVSGEVAASILKVELEEGNLVRDKLDLD
jgi:(2Fe-2S) ferredoxin